MAPGWNTAGEPSNAWNTRWVLSFRKRNEGEISEQCKAPNETQHLHSRICATAVSNQGQLPIFGKDLE
jgi:hypothetical protein